MVRLLARAARVRRERLADLAASGLELLRGPLEVLVQPPGHVREGWPALHHVIPWSTMRDVGAVDVPGRDVVLPLGVLLDPTFTPPRPFPGRYWTPCRSL